MSKVILLGLDGLDLNALEYCKDVLPNLNKLKQTSAYGSSESEYPPLTGPAWTSIITGKHISNHGMLNFFTYDKDFNLKIYDAKDIKEKRFYEILHDNNINCFIMNVPYSDSNKINGDILDSWISKKLGSDLIKPKNLADKFPTIKNYQVYKKSNTTLKEYIKALTEIAQSNSEIIKEVISKGDYEFMFFQISITDWLQHRVLLDLKYNKHTKISKYAKRSLKVLDDLVGHIIDNLGDSHFLVFSDHGMGEKKGTYFINSWLKKEGYLLTSLSGKYVKTVDDKKSRSINISFLVRIIKKSRFLIKIGKAIDRKLRRHLPFDLVKQPRIDYQNSKAVSLIKNIPIIKVFEEDKDKKESLIKEIINKLEQEKIKAWTVDEFYSGKYTTQIKQWGDIILDLKDYECDIFAGDKVFVSGNPVFHAQKGMFLASGADIKNQEIKDLSIVDIAPTVLHMFNIPIPKDFDGKVLKIFKESSKLVRRKVHFSEPKGKEEELLNSAIRNVKI